MSKQTTITCDVCGKKKEATNHWWSLVIQAGEFASSNEIGAPKVLVIGALDQNHMGTTDVCGHQCATQCLARFLDHGNMGER